jgi:hypothetical protein
MFRKQSPSTRASHRSRRASGSGPARRGRAPGGSSRNYGPGTHAVGGRPIARNPATTRRSKTPGSFDDRPVGHDGGVPARVIARPRPRVAPADNRGVRRVRAGEAHANPSRGGERRGDLAQRRGLLLPGAERLAGTRRPGRGNRVRCGPGEARRMMKELRE